MRRAPRWRAFAFAATIILGALPGVLAEASPAAAAPTAPPPVNVLTDQPGFGHGEDLFVTPTGDTETYAQGPEILSTSGQEIWFQAAPAGENAADFRTQTYRGQQVLTWFEGTTNAVGQGSGTDYIYSDNFQPIATVQAGNGQHADAHEFYITPWNTALITVYKPGTADLTSIGGPANQAVTNGVVQEIDIRTGAVLWEWNSAEHVPYSASEQPLPANASESWDWFHINAVRPNTQGTYLIDARNTWAAYDVSRHSGNVIWTLGGKDSSFTEQAAPGQTLDNVGEIFAWQHDPEPLGQGYYSFFDDEGAFGFPEFTTARAVTVKLDTHNHVATLVSSDDQPEGLIATSQGNAQTTDFGDLLVGWGNLPYLSAFDPHGNLVYNLEFPAGVNSYRAFLQPFPARGHGHGGPGKGGWPDQGGWSQRGRLGLPGR